MFSSIFSKLFDLIPGPIKAILLGLLLAGVLYFKYTYDENIRLGIANEELAKQNKNLVETLEKKIASNKINDDLNTKLEDNISKIDTNNRKVKDDTTNKVDSIKEKYSGLRMSPELIKEKDDKISLIRINSLWLSYCVDGNNNPDCSQYKVIK